MNNCPNRNRFMNGLVILFVCMAFVFSHNVQADSSRKGHTNKCSDHLVALAAGGKTIAGPGCISLGQSEERIDFYRSPGRTFEACYTVGNIGKSPVGIGINQGVPETYSPGQWGGWCDSIASLSAFCDESGRHSCEFVWRVDLRLEGPVEGDNP
jgi:hypothetical protein